MLSPSAKIEIVSEEDNSQELLLEQDLITIGRTPENTIVLNHPTVSRRHAKIIYESGNYTLIDLGSSSGTQVNNTILEPNTPYILSDGDLIRVGSAKLRFCLLLPSTSTSTITPNTPAALQATAFVPAPEAAVGTVLLETPNTPTLYISSILGSTEFLLDQSQLFLGRAADNDIVIDLPVISGRHAELRQCETGYEIIDLNSTNGLTYNGHQILQKVLVNGDTLQIGDQVTLTYRAANLTESSSQEQQVIQLNLRNRERLTLGRDPSNDTTIIHPSISRFHAEIKRHDGSLYITDNGSSNGTFVNGKRIVSDRILRPGDVIRIGPYRLIFNLDETVICQNEEGNLRLDALHLVKVTKQGATVLQDISLSILAKEFVAIVGVSGAGKSTLLDALNGFRPATSGTVLVNQTDLYKNFNAYRTELGYVPQDDIIHRELTVFQALDYAAQLRMPADTTLNERHQRIQEVLTDLELVQRQDVLISNLSGGQRKRVSMGVELLTKPSLFFLDEATSGLDPGTESQMMKLLRRLADQGRTILLITHATKNVMMCNLVIFLAKGGRVAFFGSPAEALTYFNVQDFDEIYPKVEQELSPEAWQERYLNSPEYQKYIVERQHLLQVASTEGVQLKRSQPQLFGSGTKRVSIWQQFLILSRRNLTTLARDRASLILMLAIAPLLGLLDFVTWQRHLFNVDKGEAGQAITMLFVTVLISVMVGGLTTMREIVKETEIYRRERMIGLQIAPYLLSKVWIGILLAVFQAAVFLLFKKLAVDLPGEIAVLGSLYVTLLLTTIAGMVMGLLVSALSPTQNMAPLLTILFLVPQITFGGGMLPVETFGPPGQVINRITMTKWSFESLVTATGLGRDVAEDPCWQLKEKDRKKLNNTQREQCNCLGANLFTRCNFPGIQSRYDAAVDQPQPTKPKDPGDPPKQPKEPTTPTLSAQQDYQKALDRYQKDLETYQNQVKQYRTAMDRWQEDYSQWKEKNAGAINSAEGMIERFQKDYGKAFNADVKQHWSILGLQIAVMFGLLFWVQKRKDIL